MTNFEKLWRETLTPSKSILIDGGLSSELIKLNVSFDEDLWTAKLIDQDPEKIILAHQAYIKAGAQIITTASYQATCQGLTAKGYSPKQTIDILKQSVDIAIEARERLSRDDVLVAASIGPYGAFLANGAEYTGDYDLSDEALYEFHLPRWKILNSTRADLFAVETLPSIAELRAISRLIKEYPNRACWVSLQCKNANQLADGTNIEVAADLLRSFDNLEAIGVNCLDPRDAITICQTLRDLSDKPIIAYPNLGNVYDGETHTWKTDEKRLDVKVYRQLLEQGDTIIGGCCQVDADDINTLSKSLFNLAPERL